MDFFNSAINVLQTLVIALGAGLGVWGLVNLMEGYGNDNPGAKSQGMKQLMAGAGVAVIGIVLVPLLSGLFAVGGSYRPLIPKSVGMPSDGGIPLKGGQPNGFFMGQNYGMAERNARWRHYQQSL